MTPKEKAEELKEKFDGYICYAEATVDEIIKVVEEICDDRGYDPFEAPLYTLNYYKEVKQEIEKL
jgi:hypothetical protein